MTIDLNSGWELRPEGLEMSALDWPLIERKTEGWFPCSLPCDVRMPLIEKGVIAEPLEGLNCFDSEWVEDRSWWFRKRFTADASFAAAAECRLRFEMLDVEADIFLNGRLAGHQRSAFYPFEVDVKPLLVPGENVLGVRLTCGLERVKDGDFAGYSRCIATEALAGRGTRGDKRRAHLRKPQYVFGWDWGPRVATCAIPGDATLTLVGAMRVASVRAVTTAINGTDATLHVTVEAENTHPWSTVESRVSVRLLDGKRAVADAAAEQLLRSGVNHVDFDLHVPGAKLWWPNGLGRAALVQPGDGGVTRGGGTARGRGHHQDRHPHALTRPDARARRKTVRPRGERRAHPLQGIGLDPGGLPVRAGHGREVPRARQRRRRPPTSRCFASGAAAATRVTPSTMHATRPGS